MDKHFSKLYLRTSGNNPLSTEKYPLAFATPYEDNAAGRKRQESVDSWAGGGKWDNGQMVYPEGSHIIENVPVEGFKFDKSVSRYRTDNKWFRICDPRGFTLEISADNMTDLIHNGKLENGEIIGKYCWVRRGSQNYLVREDNEIFKEIKVQKTDGIELFDIVETQNYDKLIYCGVYYSAHFKLTSERVPASNRGTYMPYSYYSSYTYEYTLQPVRDTKSFHLFAYAEKDGKYSFVKYRSLPKYKITGKSEPVEVPLGEEVRVDSLSVSDDMLHHVFKTKEDVKAFEFDYRDLRSRVNAERRYTKLGPDYKVFLFVDEKTGRTSI